MPDQPLPVAEQPLRQSEELHGDDPDRQRGLAAGAGRPGRSATRRWPAARSRRPARAAPSTHAPAAAAAPTGRANLAVARIPRRSESPGAAVEARSRRHRRCAEIGDAVGQRDQRGPVGDHDHGPALAPAAAPPPAPRSRSRRRGWRSARRAAPAGASWRNRRASASRWRSPADSAAPRSPSRRPQPAGPARQHARRGRPRPPRPGSPRRSRPGGGSAMLSAIDAGEQVRPLRHPGEPRPPGVGVQVGELAVADPDRPVVERRRTRAARRAASTCRSHSAR